MLTKDELVSEALACRLQGSTQDRDVWLARHDADRIVERVLDRLISDMESVHGREELRQIRGVS